MTAGEPAATASPGVVLVVDVANVMGSRPDGWWRDRAGAAARLLARLAALPGTRLPEPSGGAAEASGWLQVDRVVAVVEGQARGVAAPSGVELVRAEADGDGAIVAFTRGTVAPGELLVVTADRGLRSRLPGGARVAGPRWLWAALDGLDRPGGLPSSP